MCKGGVKFFAKFCPAADCVVPTVGIEPTLPKELDFESSASTNSAKSAAVAGGEPYNGLDKLLLPSEFSAAKVTLGREAGNGRWQEVYGVTNSASRSYSVAAVTRQVTMSPTRR